MVVPQRGIGNKDVLVTLSVRDAGVMSQGHGQEGNDHAIGKSAIRRISGEGYCFIHLLER